MELFNSVLLQMKKFQNYWFFSQMCKYKDYLALIFLNIFTHYLFIGYFKFVTDDWPQVVYSDIAVYPLNHLLFESQRTGQFVLTKIVVDVLGDSVLGYQIINLISTTILLLFVYLILKELLKNILLNPTPFAFMGAVLFCILFNKDELYPWSAIFYDSIAFVLYFGSFYFYLQSAKKWYYLYVSWLFFAVAIFIYEIGVLLPFIYIFYAVIQQKDWKKALFFFIPPMVYYLVRITNWFGYGWIYIDRHQNYFSLQFLSMFVNNCIHNLMASIGITIINPFYAVLGLAELNVIILFMLLILDFVISWMIVNYFICSLTKNAVSINYDKKSFQMILFCLIGLCLSYITISAHGIVQPRYLLFIDFFAILLLVILILPLVTNRKFVPALIVIITVCLLINQGLYVNWIVDGEIQDSVNKAIFSHADEISDDQYFFINSSDLFRSKPNYAFNIGPNYSLIFNQNSNEVYYPYLNSVGLARWAVLAMMRGAKINESSTTLIYGDDANVFVEEKDGILKYKEAYSGKYFLINKSDCFEGNSSNLLTNFDIQMKANWLFRQ